MGMSHPLGPLKGMALLTVPKVWTGQALIRPGGENLAVGGGGAWKPRMYWTEGPSPSWQYGALDPLRERTGLDSPSGKSDGSENIGH